MSRYAELPRDFNAAHYFLDRAVEDGYGHRVALRCGGDAWTYAALADLSDRVGSAIRDLGVEPEDRVLLALADGPEFVASWYGALKIGAVSTEVYTFLQPKDYAYALAYTAAKVVICDEQTRDRIRSVAADVPSLRHVVVVGPRTPLDPRERNFERLTRDASAGRPVARTTKGDFALWKFTTGSTGAPKAVVHAHYAPYCSFHAYALGVLGLRADDLVLPVPKLFFGYARDLTALFPFGVGAAGVVFPERATPERLFDLIEAHRPTILVQVPTMINAMCDHPDARRRDLGSLRLCTSAGEALPAEVYDKWMRTFGVEVLDGIGSSEMYHIYISNRPGDVRPGSVGKLVPGYDAKICDPAGAALPDGEAGELWIRGETAGLMYWQDRAKSIETFHADWVRTGDLFVRDRDGRFWYQGRADDLIKSGGVWIAPLEVEGCLLAHPDVAECAVVAYEENGLARARAIIVPHDPARARDALAEALRAHVRARLAGHKVPRDVRFATALPRTPSGKLDRKRLRAEGSNAGA